MHTAYSARGSPTFYPDGNGFAEKQSSPSGEKTWAASASIADPFDGFWPEGEFGI